MSDKTKTAKGGQNTRYLLIIVILAIIAISILLSKPIGDVSNRATSTTVPMETATGAAIPVPTCCSPFCDDGPEDCKIEKCDAECEYRTVDCPCSKGYCNPDPDCQTRKDKK